LIGKLPLLGYLKNKISQVILTNDYREAFGAYFFSKQLPPGRVCGLLQKEERLLQKIQKRRPLP